MNEKNSTALVTRPASEWDTVQRQARAFMQSGYLREEFTKGVDPKTSIAKIATVITMGDELGIGRMQALRSINVIKGKPTLAAELMLALAYKRIPGFKATFKTPVDKQHLECTVLMQRPGGDENEFKFTIQDAKNAGLEFISQQGKPTAWTKYPRAMLRARVISEGLRAIAPDATMGLYATEELGNEIVDVEALPNAQEPHDTKKLDNAAENKTSQEIKAPEKRVETGNTQWYDKKLEENKKKLATDKQVDAIKKMGAAAGYSQDDLCGYAFDWHGKDKLEDLTQEEIQDFFEQLKPSLAK